MNEEITALLKARNTLLQITTCEEGRVERAIIASAARAKYETYFWDCAQGVIDMNGKAIKGENMTDPTAALNWIRDSGGRGLYVMRDLHKWYDSGTLRTLRNLARSFQALAQNDAKTLLILTPVGDVPPELRDHVTVLDYPIPDREEIAKILDATIKVNERKPKADADDDKPVRTVEALSSAARDAAIDAAVGLSGAEATNCYTKSLVTMRRIDTSVVASEKKRVIAREKVLTWIDPDPRGLDAIGGFNLLKVWLDDRKGDFSVAARDFGITAPKGALLLGPPGVGKSLTAKCIATAWGMPLLRLDMGALRSKFVGESEGNIRKALQTAEAVAPCVLWCDELEKSLAGASGAQGDGGVAADAFGAILTWMQEKAGSVFVIATANDVRGLPPELLRKGRFDEVFWLDLPTAKERTEILAATLRQFKHGLKVTPEEMAIVTRNMIEFTGAEVAAVVPDALRAAFRDGARDICLADLEKASATVVPLSKTAADKLKSLREWAEGRARPASSPEESVIVDVSQLGGRRVDFVDDEDAN